MDLNFKFKRFHPRRGGGRGPRFTIPTVFFGRTQATFNPAFSRKVLEDIGIRPGEKGRIVVDYDPNLNAMAFYPVKGHHPDSVGFLPQTKSTESYRISVVGLYKEFPIQKRIQKVGRNWFHAELMVVDNPEEEGGKSEAYIIFIQ